MLNGLPPQTAARKWAHDIRNAFNCIRLCTAAIDVCPEKSERLEMLDEIVLATDRAIEMLDAMPLDLAGELSGKPTISADSTAIPA